MNHRIPCEIIQDLMPMYADGLTSETTDREIRSHLEECETCREMYERMKAEMEGDTSQTAGEPPEIDYLKKVRRKNVRNVVLAAAGVFLFMAAALFMKLFVIGYPTESYVLTYTDVNGEQVNVGGVMSDSAAVYRGYKLGQEDGAQRLGVYSCLPSVWNRSGTFNLELALPGGLVPRAMEHSCQRDVCFTDLDRNGHMNNTRYMDWIDDLLPSDFHREHPVKEFAVRYHSEAREGQRLDLHWDFVEDNCLRVDARRRNETKDELVFSAKVLFD